MFGIPTFDLLTDRGKQEFIQYVINLMRNEIISFTSSYNQSASGLSQNLPDTLLVNAHMIGTNALRPNAGEVTPGTYYTSTDVSGGTTYRSDGIAWTQISGGVQGGTLGYYGSFVDTTTQSVATINTATAITLNTTLEANGVSRGSPTSRIVMANAGTYNIQFSAQLDQSAASTKQIWIWLRANGTDVTDSNSLVTLQGSSTEDVAAWNWIYTTTTTNEYVEIMWATDDTGTKMTAFASPTNGPAIPSVIVSVTQVMNTQAGPTGPTGPTGTAATINVGTVTTNTAGSNATVVNSGTTSAAVFDFGLPGSPTVNAGTTTTNAAGTNATVTASGTQYARVFDFGIPGNPTVVVGTTTTSAPGGNASVVNSGTSNALVLDFTIPQGSTGPTGPTGPAGVGNPPGAIIAFSGTTLPSDYLWCDGSLVSKTTYAGLYAVLGANRYGTDTSTDFYLPDLRARFPRGTATTSGSVSTTNTNSHTHTLNTFNAATTLNAFNASTTLNATTASFSGTAVNASNNNIGGAGAHNHNVNATNVNQNNQNATRAAGNAGVALSSHNHTTAGASTSSDPGNHGHSFTYTPGGNVSVTTGTANTTITNGTATTNITSGTNNNQDHIPAYVEVNYIIKT